MQTRSANQLTAMFGDIVATIEVIIPLELGGKVMKGWLLNLGGGFAVMSYFSYQTSYMILKIPDLLWNYYTSM